MEKSTSQEGYPAIKSSHARPFISILHCNLTILGSHLKRCSTKAGGSWAHASGSIIWSKEDLDKASTRDYGEIGAI